MKTAADLIAEAKQRISELTPQEVRDMQTRGADAVYLDVREPAEWNLGHVPGAIHMPRGMMEGTIEGRVPRDAQVVVYCASGNRSALAADTLREMGYTHVASMRGGIGDWAAIGGDIEG